MADDQTNHQDGEEDGKSLRKKLEAALAENATLKGSVVELKAQALISEKGYKLIKASDLKGVDLDDIEKKAADLEAERFEQGKDVLKASLEARGLTGDALEEAVTQLFEQSGNVQTVTALSRLQQVGSTTGTPVPRGGNENVAPGFDRINAALSA